MNDPQYLEAQKAQKAQDYRKIKNPLTEDGRSDRADKILARYYPFFSRSEWTSRINRGWVLFGGKPGKASTKLSPGISIHLFHPEDIEPDVDCNIESVYQDADVMVLYKPSGLPMHENGPYRRKSFLYLLRQTFGEEWSFVHRLDRETSGLILCGASSETRSTLSKDLQSGRIKKTYNLIVKGQCEMTSWEVNEPIGDLKSSQIRIKKWVCADGQPSLTKFKLIEQKREHALVEATPITGRTNQIRIHAAYSGLPLVGDKLYHSDESVFLNYFDQGPAYDATDTTGHSRVCLHASGLRFPLPKNREIIDIYRPLPNDLANLWASLK